MSAAWMRLLAGQACSHPHLRHWGFGSCPRQLHGAVAQLKFPHPGSRPVLPSDDLEGMKPPLPEWASQAASFPSEALRCWETGLQGPPSRLLGVPHVLTSAEECSALRVTVRGAKLLSTPEELSCSGGSPGPGSPEGAPGTWWVQYP